MLLGSQDDICGQKETEQEMLLKASGQGGGREGVSTTDCCEHSSTHTGWSTLLSHPLKGPCQRGKIDDNFLARRAVLSQFPKPSQW